MLRITCALVFCVGAYLLGQVYVSTLREKLDTINDYCAFVRHLISTVRFSASDVRDGAKSCTSGGAARFAQTLIFSDDLLTALQEYRPRGKEETSCVRIVRVPIALAAQSSDKSEVVHALLQAEQELLRLLQQTEESCRGKLKAAPRAALTAGLFLAVLVI